MKKPFIIDMHFFKKRKSCKEGCKSSEKEKHHHVETDNSIKERISRYKRHKSAKGENGSLGYIGEWNSTLAP